MEKKTWELTQEELEFVEVDRETTLKRFLATNPTPEAYARLSLKLITQKYKCAGHGCSNQVAL
jgi:hypothetical protein